MSVPKRLRGLAAYLFLAPAAVAIGTRHTRLPHGCTGYDHLGRPYYRYGTVYYQPVYDGPNVVYVVVEKP